MALRRLLTSRAARRSEGLFVVEGPRLLAEALAAPLPVHDVYVEDGAAWPGATLVRPGTLDRLGDVVTSQGVLAVVGAPDERLGPRLLAGGVPATAPLVLVLVAVADPGNVGTILRTAEAVGATVLCCGKGVDPLAPKVVRAAAGAAFRVPYAVVDDPGEALAWCEAEGLSLLATVVEGGEELYDRDLRGPVAVVLGSEAQGLPPEVVQRAGVRPTTLPMAGGVESLNVAMAATAIAFEAWRQRRRNGLDALVVGGQAEHP